jgi:hypothetical protein
MITITALMWMKTTSEYFNNYKWENILCSIVCVQFQRFHWLWCIVCLSLMLYGILNPEKSTPGSKYHLIFSPGFNI